MMKKNISRRRFVRRSVSSAATLTALGPATGAAQGANERLRIGFVGVGTRGFGGHVRRVARLKEFGVNVDLAAVCDVYKPHEERAVQFIEEQTGKRPKTFRDYRDILAEKDIDAVFIGTPDHWHARQSIDAMQAGKHVYCEKPMTKTTGEAFAVVDAWKATGRVMQVGVQSTSLPVWSKANELIRAGKIGKLIQFQTEFYRNTNFGQWRVRPLTTEISPETVDWRRWLGVDEGLAPDMPFDRAMFLQWRCYWPFGAGMYTDLFVHRTTSMLKATGLRLPARVVGGGGIFYEYDGRDVPDVSTIVADYNEGVQLLVTASMVTARTPIKQIIRGHTGSFVFGNGEKFTGFDFLVEDPRVTGDKQLQDERIEAGEVADTSYTHMENFIAAIRANDQQLSNNPPDLGAAAVATVNLGARSYREGKAFFLDPDTRRISDTDPGWARQWEQMSKQRAKPKHVPGWEAGDKGSLLASPEYMRLAGPWIGGKPPEDQQE